MLLADFNAKLDREDSLKRTKIGNESLHEIVNDNRVRAVHFATSENFKSNVQSHIAIFININIHNYNPDG
jgi:hypothetical protein